MTGTRTRRERLASALGIAVVVACFAALARSLAGGFEEVRPAIADARPAGLGLALGLSLVAMLSLAGLWWAVLHTFRHALPLPRVVGWYFAGELGKYLPGGVWTVIGRGELARRGGVPRADSYATVVVSMLVTIVAGLASCAGLLVVGAVDGAQWIGLLLLAACLVVVHPRAMAAAFWLAQRATRGRVLVPVQPWTVMLRLVALALPMWAAVGAASTLVAGALGFDADVADLALAAIAAWLAGLAVVPIPAGAGVRELVFVELSGLAPAPAALVATLGRLLFVLVDGVGGAIALHGLRREAASPPSSPTMGGAPGPGRRISG